MMTRSFKKTFPNILDIKIRNLLLFVFICVCEVIVLLGSNNFNFDEIMLIFSLLFFAAGLLKNNRILWNIFLVMFLFFLCGCIPFIFNGYSRSIYLIVADFFLLFKFVFYFAGIYSFLSIFYKKFNLTKIIKANYIFLAILIFLIFLLILYEKFVLKIGQVTLFAEYNGYPAIFLVYAEIYFLFSWKKYSFQKKNVFMRFLIILTIFFGLLLLNNSTAIITAFVVAALFFEEYFKIKTSLMIFILFLLGIVFVIMFFYKIKDYFFNIEHPRFLLYFNSLILLLKYFPFGVGFSLYGTTIAASNYSPLYYELGFDGRWGMSYGENFFLNDAFYPGIIGEVGLLGIILFAYLIFTLISSLKTKKGLFSNKLLTTCMLVLLLNGITFNILNTQISFILFFFAIMCYFDKKTFLKRRG